MSIRSQQDLAVFLSKLKSFSKPSFKLEQYATPSNIAAEWLWNMSLQGEVAGKTILDAACGPGILGLGSLLLGAKKVYFLDQDKEVISICMENYKQLSDEYEVGEAKFIIGDISLFDAEVDVVVQNPPFGTKNEHIDKTFLQKAFSLAKVVYSMHKYSTKVFIEAISKDYGFKITHFWRFEFPIKATFAFHHKPVKEIDVGLWRLEKTI